MSRSVEILKPTKLNEKPTRPKWVKNDASARPSTLTSRLGFFYKKNALYKFTVIIIIIVINTHISIPPYVVTSEATWNCNVNFTDGANEKNTKISHKLHVK